MPAEGAQILSQVHDLLMSFMDLPYDTPLKQDVQGLLDHVGQLADQAAQDAGGDPLAADQQAQPPDTTGGQDLTMPPGSPPPDQPPQLPMDQGAPAPPPGGGMDAGPPAPNTFDGAGKAALANFNQTGSYKKPKKKAKA